MALITEIRSPAETSTQAAAGDGAGAAGGGSLSHPFRVFFYLSPWFYRNEGGVDGGGGGGGALNGLGPADR